MCASGDRDSGAAACGGHRDGELSGGDSVIPTVSAKILSCSIEEGDTVTAGQVLYVLDSGALEDQITQARLSLNSAQASYAQAVDACTDLTVPAHASGTVRRSMSTWETM